MLKSGNLVLHHTAFINAVVFKAFDCVCVDDFSRNEEGDCGGTADLGKCEDTSKAVFCIDSFVWREGCLADGYSFLRKLDLRRGNIDHLFLGDRKQSGFEFFDFFETAAKHLKSCFPEIKIGGPALAFRDEWAEEFLKTMSERNVPLDFYSWHIYLKEPSAMVNRAKKMKDLLLKYGYDKTENICNEWNYVKGWTDEFPYTVEQIHGIKGAIVTMSTVCVAQSTSLDMLMYYDTRPSTFNGIFDFYTAKPLKGYFAMYWYGMFYDMKAEVRAINEIENVYSLCGVDENGKVLAIVTHYSDNDDVANKEISIDFGKEGEYEIYLLDDGHNGELIATTDKLEFDMKLHSAILIKEK